LFHTSEKYIRKSERHVKKIALILSFIALSALFFQACSIFPKVMVLDDPLSKEDHLDLGLAYENEGKLDLAEREFLAADPLPQAVLALGNVYFQKGEYVLAEKYYLRSIRKSKDPNAMNNLAFLYVIEGRKLKNAAKLAERAVEEGIKQNLSDEEIRNFKSTYNQAETALSRSRAKSE
jgi:Flp pilus assembly protein TadD